MKQENTNKTSPPIIFWVISIIALLWFLMDVSAFFMRVFMTEGTLMAMPEDQRQHFQNTPLWVNVVFAFEAFGGTLGCIGLLLRKKWALPLFIISLVGVVSQTAYIYFFSDAISIMGMFAIVMPLVAIGIGIGLTIFSSVAISKNWLHRN